MLAAGIDAGSLSTKVVILEHDKILSASVLSIADEGAVIAEKALDDALKKASISLHQIENIAATGCARKSVTFTNITKSEVLCHSTGALLLFPNVRTVIDIGAESSKVASLNKNGKMIDFAVNDKCAAGTGIFLDTMAKAMEISIEDVGRLSLKCNHKAEISSMCAVFAESEVISQIHRGTPVNDILAGIHESIAERVASMANRVGIKEDIVMTGGVAKNIGMVKALEQKLGKKVYLPEDPLIIGALGAAIIAANL